MVQAKGTKAAHTFDASVRRGRHETHLSLSGIWHQGAWRGKYYVWTAQTASVHGNSFDLPLSPLHPAACRLSR